MTTLLLPVLALMSGRQTTSVSFTCRAEPMSRLVGELGKATGLNLSVSNACANDVLVISVADVPVNQLLLEIAKVDSGEWKPTNNGYIFGIDNVARRTEARHENERQGSLIRALIAKRLNEATKSSANTSTPQEAADPQKAALDFLNAPTPEKTAILKLLSELEPASLVVDANHRVVFSTRPNQVQLSMGSGAEAVIENLVVEHNSKLPKEPSQAQVPAAAGGDEQTSNFINQFMTRTTKRIDGYYKADLVVGSAPFLGGLSASLVLYDDKGGILLTASDSLDTSGFESFLAKPPPDSGSATPIEESEETLAFTKYSALGSGSFMNAPRPLPPLLKPLLTNPEEHDPLSLLPTDELLALAKARQKPLVAVVPDSALSLLGSLSGVKPTIESFVKQLEDGKTMVKNFENGWIEIKPVAPENARENRTDRAALAKLLRATRAKRVPSLDDIAEFAQRAPSPMTEGVTQVYLSLFVPGSTGIGMDGFTDWNMYRIYGQIAADRRQSLLAGGRVPIDLLTSGQQGYLAEMVYGPLSQLQVGKPAEGDTNFISQMMKMSMGGQDYKDEPTELLPSGLPRGGSFQMTAQEEPFLSPIPENADGSEIPQILGADEMALFKYMDQQPMFVQAASMMPKFDQMKLGSRVVYHLTFSLTDNIRITGTLKDSRLPDDAETVSANNLPSNMQDLIAKKMADLKNSPFGSMLAGAFAGKAAAPPPR